MIQIETFYNTIRLSSGYYIKKKEIFEGGWGIKGIEKHYDPYNRCVYVKEYDNKGNIYEQWRNYHSNGELSGIYDTNGFKQEFDYRGLPIKE